MNLKHLDEFYREIQTIDIHFENVEGKPRHITLSHYNQHHSNYNTLITEQRELALSIILLLKIEQIQFQANRLQLIDERLNLFWTWYSKELGKFREGDFYTTEFIYYLDTYLTINNSRQDLNEIWNYHDDRFLYDLGDAVMRKQGGAKFLLYSIKSITGIEPKLTGGIEERAEEESKLVNRKVSYNWPIVDIELKALYDALCKDHITKTTLSDFKAAFSNQVIGSFKPVRWASDNATELIYFITSINKLSKKGRENNDWVRLANCFVKPDGSQFNKESFKSLYQALDRDLSQQKRDSIDRLLQPFK